VPVRTDRSAPGPGPGAGRELERRPAEAKRRTTQMKRRARLHKGPAKREMRRGRRGGTNRRQHRNTVPRGDRGGRVTDYPKRRRGRASISEAHRMCQTSDAGRKPVARQEGSARSSRGNQQGRADQPTPGDADEQLPAKEGGSRATRDAGPVARAADAGRVARTRGARACRRLRGEREPRGGRSARREARQQGKSETGETRRRDASERTSEAGAGPPTGGVDKAGEGRGLRAKTVDDNGRRRG